MKTLHVRGRVQSLFWATTLAAVCLSATPLKAAVVWHESVAAAKAASAASRRPVLVVFTASWSAASDRFVQSTLVTPEASAIVANCFEPVRLDVDANADLAKRLGVSHLPTACIVGPDDSLLVRFDCPESSAEFVSEAARAIQQAAQNASAAGPAAAAAVATGTSTPIGRPASSAFSASEPPPAPTLPASPPGWPAETASQPLGPAPADRMSAFAAASAPQPPAAAPTMPTPPPVAPAAAPPTGRPLVEPQPASPSPSPSPWLSQPASPPPPGATTAQPPAYPMTPYPAPAAAGVAVAPSASAAPPAAEEKPKDSNPFIAFFKNPASAFSWSSGKESVDKPSAGATPQPAEPRTPSIASQVPAVAPPGATDIYGTMPVGLEGYCPVTLVEKSTWVEGRPQWGARHRGRTYLFAGPAEQQAFLTAPDRYAPALSGDDPVLALDSGRQVPGQRRYGVTYQSRIYLFSSPETRAAFTTAPDRYTTRVVVAENPQMGGPSVIR